MVPIDAKNHWQVYNYLQEFGYLLLLSVIVIYIYTSSVLLLNIVANNQCYIYKHIQYCQYLLLLSIILFVHLSAVIRILVLHSILVICTNISTIDGIFLLTFIVICTIICSIFIICFCYQLFLYVHLHYFRYDSWYESFLYIQTSAVLLLSIVAINHFICRNICSIAGI